MRTNMNHILCVSLLIAFTGSVKCETVGALSKSQTNALKGVGLSVPAAVRQPDFADSLPLVASVNGKKEKLTAVLLYSDGSTDEVKIGETLEGEIKIVMLTADLVEVQKGKRIVKLRFVDAPESLAQGQGDRPHESAKPAKAIPLVGAK